MTKCEKPPTGWDCSRVAGHDGPCASAPKEPEIDWSCKEEPPPEFILAVFTITFALIGGSVGGLIVLVWVGFWSAILGFLFTGIIAGVLGFLFSIQVNKAHAKSKADALSQVRAPDAAGIQPDLSVSEEREAEASVAVQ